MEICMSDMNSYVAIAILALEKSASLFLKFHTSHNVMQYMITTCLFLLIDYSIINIVLRIQKINKKKKSWKVSCF